MIRYEFLMQIRKRSLWISTALLAALISFTQGDRGPRILPADASAREVMTGWALVLSILLPLGFGMVLADRLVRDRRLGVSRLLDSFPTGAPALVAGKYVGSVAATAVPGLVAMLLAAGFEFANRRDPPCWCGRSSRSRSSCCPVWRSSPRSRSSCPLVLTAPLFRVLFVGYWFWGNMLSPAWLPSLTGTLLTPIGDYAASWLLGERGALRRGADWLSGACGREPERRDRRDQRRPCCCSVAVAAARARRSRCSSAAAAAA